VLYTVYVQIWDFIMAEMYKNPFFQIITVQHIFVWLTHVRCKH